MDRKLLKTRRAFTLIELLTVIAIIGILAALIVGLSGYAGHKANVGKAKADLEKIKNALEEYRLQYGVYPNDDATLADSLWNKPKNDPKVGKPFLVMPGWGSPTADYTLKDPWGNPYLYEHKSAAPYATHNNSKFGYDLSSKGPDGVKDTGDDLNNWAAPTE